MEITKENLKIAMQKCIVNAGNLIDDANLLYANGRAARAYTLYQLAMEEVGKAMMRFYFLLSKDLNNEKDRKLFTKDFLSHKSKTKQAIGVDLMFLSVYKKEVADKYGFIQDSFKDFRNTAELNDFKNFSLYTSFVDGTFKTPDELITPDATKKIQFRATLRFGTARNYLNMVLSNQINFDEFDEDYRQMSLKFNSDSIGKEFWDELNDEGS